MWPQRWLTPVSGFDHAAERPSATPTPTSRQPARPGPRVAAMRSMSLGFAPAPSRARSRRCGRRSRWSRAASSGTTPPNSLCSSTCEWMTLERTRRPSSTTATDVSSQLVSMPSVSDILRPTLSPTLSPAGRGGLNFPTLSLAGSVPLGDQVSSEAADVRFYSLQVLFVGAAEARAVDAVRPHHDGVLAVVGVVALTPSYDLEAEGLVHLHRVLVARAHLESHPFRTHVIGRLDEAGEHDAPVAAVLQVAPHPDRGYVRLVVHAPHSPVTDDRRVEVRRLEAGRALEKAFLAKHYVVRAGA